ncbi:MAG TPA: hypothetical protein VJO35_18925 [Terriglobales bacterium]|nr:hypothetical protein [Terriglobales bacterium]
MKSEVYSWRLSSEKKVELETEARREGKSVAQVLDEISGEWLNGRRNARNGDEQEQERIRKRMMKVVGSLSGGDPERASRASRRVKEILREKYGRHRSR